MTTTPQNTLPIFPDSYTKWTLGADLPCRSLLEDAVTYNYFMDYDNPRAEYYVLVDLSWWAGVDDDLLDYWPQVLFPTEEDMTDFMRLMHPITLDEPTVKFLEEYERPWIDDLFARERRKLDALAG